MTLHSPSPRCLLLPAADLDTAEESQRYKIGKVRPRRTRARRGQVVRAPVADFTRLRCVPTAALNPPQVILERAKLAKEGPAWGAAGARDEEDS